MLKTKDTHIIRKERRTTTKYEERDSLNRIIDA